MAEAGVCRQSCCHLRPVSVLKCHQLFTTLCSSLQSLLVHHPSAPASLQLFKGADKRQQLRLEVFPQTLLTIPIVMFKRSEWVRDPQEESRAATKPHFLQSNLIFRKDDSGSIFSQKTPTRV